MSVRLRRTFALAAAAAAVLATVLAVPARVSATPSYGMKWGSLAKVHESLSPAPLSVTRTGRNACWDRIVFEFDGQADGYRVDYVDAVRTQGEGRVLSVAGGARLSVTLLQPAYDQSGHITYPHRSGDHVASVAGYSTLRDVVYGGSFEGYTTFGVGVRARLPFRVFTLPGPGTKSRIVIDIAHRW